MPYFDAGRHSQHCPSSCITVPLYRTSEQHGHLYILVHRPEGVSFGHHSRLDPVRSRWIGTPTLSVHPMAGRSVCEQDAAWHACVPRREASCAAILAAHPSHPAHPKPSVGRAPQRGKGVARASHARHGARPSPHLPRLTVCPWAYTPPSPSHVATLSRRAPRVRRPLLRWRSGLSARSATRCAALAAERACLPPSHNQVSHSPQLRAASLSRR